MAAYVVSPSLSRGADPSNLRSGRDEFRTVKKLDLFTTSLGVQELYPSTRQGSDTGDSSEAMSMYDLLSAGIAIHDEG